MNSAHYWRWFFEVSLKPFLLSSRKKTQNAKPQKRHQIFHHTLLLDDLHSHFIGEEHKNSNNCYAHK